MQLKIKRVHPDAIIPKYATSGAACFDLHVLLENEYVWSVVAPGEPIVLRTGLAIEIPPGYAMEIYSRSGHGFKNDIRLANCVGVIDSDYRGELMVKLTNDNADNQSITLHHGDRIAQARMVLAPQWDLVEVLELTDTVRGAGGFGSTGGGGQ